ncbi:aldehyde dehydrogenase family protein [Specibacter sp. NPDC057265]|uniref:aldehyde dehydrogenase family protein n=1 Tax=Specibacter sp. NPDC057265 TaxID=3346075 RepID=UPI00363CD0CD
MKPLSRPASHPAPALPEEDLVVTNPRTGALVGQVQPSSAEGVAAACRSAAAAGAQWAATSARDRGQALSRCAKALEKQARALAQIQHLETGRAVDEALEGVLAGVATLEQYAQLGPVHRGKSLRGAGIAADYTVQRPRGVVAALTPWNDPVAVACGLIGAALVMGNTVVHKPSERCPHLGQELGRVLAAELPGDVLLTLTGAAATGAALAADSHVRVIAHVGSSATGEKLRLLAATTGAHVIVENGGNDPLVVDDGVDPVWAARQASIGAFSNSGQICTSVERIYVHQGIAEAFLEALEAEAGGINAALSLGPLVDGRLRDHVHRQVQDAVAQGAHATVGGAVPQQLGSHYPATVLRGCTETMAVMQEETFGPVAPVQVVDSFAQGLELAARGRYGLAASVLTGSLLHAQQAVAALDVGTVKINNVFGGAPGGAAQPRRASGAGFGYGPELLDEMSLVTVVHIEPAPEAGP